MIVRIKRCFGHARPRDSQNNTMAALPAINWCISSELMSWCQKLPPHDVPVKACGTIPNNPPVLSGFLWWGGTLMGLVARATRNAIRANRFAIETFAIETPIFIARQADSQESLEFSDSRESPDTRESCESIRTNHATKLMGGERCLSVSYMTVRCRWALGERHCAVMQMLRSFALPRARQRVSRLFGGTVFVCPVLTGIRPSQIPGSPPPRSPPPPTKESQY